MRLGEAIVTKRDVYHHKGWTRCDWTCACHGVKKAKMVEHLLFDCMELSEEREKMEKAVREEENRRAKEARERGGCAKESTWGKLTMLGESPGAVLDFLGDVLGEGSAIVVEAF